MFILQSVIVYTLLALFMFVFAKRATTAEQHKLLLNAIPIILFTLVFGLRYSVGVDWENYRETYEEDMIGLSSLGEMITDSRLEVGFVFVIYLCKLMALPTYMLFVVCSFIQILLLYIALKDEDGILPYIYLTFIFSGIAISGFTNVIRQDIAFCFFLWALKFAKERRLLPYVLLCVCAFCFHKSAIIIFPCYLLWLKRDNLFYRPKIQAIVLISCFILHFFNPIESILVRVTDLITILGYDNYMDIVEDLIVNKKISITRIVGLLANLFIILNSNRLKEYYNSPLFCRMYDLFLIGICCSYLFLGSMLFLRIILYFTNFLFIVYAYAFRFFWDTKLKDIRSMICLGMLSLALITSFASLMHSAETNTCAYVSYFQTDLHSIKDAQREAMFLNRD